MTLKNTEMINEHKRLEAACRKNTEEPVDGSIKPRKLMSESDALGP